MGTSQLPSILPPESLYDVISWFNVSWYDAIEYCNKRSEQEGLTPAYTIDKSQSDPNNQSNNDKLKWLVTWNQETNGYRLPTEAEWEYACRAGTTGPFNTGENITTDQANYDGNYPYNNNPTGMNRGGPTYLGSFEPNSWGLYDMHGNMWEWCWDWDGDYPRLYFENSMTNPVGPSSGKSRIRRGGSWADPARYLRSANRGGAYPSDRNFTLGCRLVRSCL
jgi:formylglycine-generating enzyme required for sulfatase activity